RPLLRSVRRPRGGLRPRLVRTARRSRRDGGWRDPAPRHRRARADTPGAAPVLRGRARVGADGSISRRRGGPARADRTSVRLRESPPPAGRNGNGHAVAPRTPPRGRATLAAPPYSVYVARKAAR